MDGAGLAPGARARQLGETKGVAVFAGRLDPRQQHAAVRGHGEVCLAGAWGSWHRDLTHRRSGGEEKGKNSNQGPQANRV